MAETTVKRLQKQIRLLRARMKELEAETRTRGEWVDLPFARGDSVVCQEDGRRPWTGTVLAIEANNYHSDRLSVVYVVTPDGGSRKYPEHPRRRRYMSPWRLTAVTPRPPEDGA